MKVTIKVDNGFGRVDEFEIVKHIPAGYKIWNIGDNMAEGYLPLCQLKKGTFSVIPETLKAIKMEQNEIDILMNASHYGAGDYFSAKRKVLKGDRMGIENIKGYVTKKGYQLAKLALPIYERLREEA